MITGVHALVFTREAEAVRAFFRDALGLPSVDAGGGWPIFTLPPAELAVHPSEGPDRHELYLMCDDIHATVAELARRGVEVTGPVREERFGLVTALRVSGAGEIAIYEPRHPTGIRPPG